MFSDMELPIKYVGIAGLSETQGAFHLRKKPGNFGGSKSGISDR